MSGLTPFPLYSFRRMLRARGSSCEMLADEIGGGRAHTSQVLNGHRPGGDTWARIYAVVTEEEWAVLSQLEHCATWNRRQLAAGETAMVWQMRVQCGGCRRWEGFRPCVQKMARKVTHGLCPECYAIELAKLEAMSSPAVETEDRRRPYLVRTEAGLAVHRSETRPALADDRELPQAYIESDAATTPIRCELGRGAARREFR